MADGASGRRTRFSGRLIPSGRPELVVLGGVLFVPHSIDMTCREVRSAAAARLRRRGISCGYKAGEGEDVLYTTLAREVVEGELDKWAGLLREFGLAENFEARICVRKGGQQAAIKTDGVERRVHTHGAKSVRVDAQAIWKGPSRITAAKEIMAVLGVCNELREPFVHEAAPEVRCQIAGLDAGEDVATTNKEVVEWISRGDAVVCGDGTFSSEDGMVIAGVVVFLAGGKLQRADFWVVGRGKSAWPGEVKAGTEGARILAGLGRGRGMLLGDCRGMFQRLSSGASCSYRIRCCIFGPAARRPGSIPDVRCSPSQQAVSRRSCSLV